MFLFIGNRNYHTFEGARGHFGKEGNTELDLPVTRPLPKPTVLCGSGNDDDDDDNDVITVMMELCPGHPHPAE